MYLQKDLIVVVAIIVLSQWAGQIWLASQHPSDTSSHDGSRLENTVVEMRQQLERIESMQAAKVVTVNPEANTVTIDQTVLQDTLRNIVADEIARVSPSLSAEYTDSTPGTAYVGETTYMAPEHAYTQSAAIMQEAIQYGEWDARHTAELTPLLNNLTQEQRIALLEQYHDALNRGVITMTGIAPPL